ncbi:putative lipid II flippase FtsW [Radiobacillus sp. PE A8.2]|uniref:putative lipid II flippase FtsW n=1 Tax=Radiobacillus sp. PE A8.2 TaxID=3380349 RepID=UPI00388E1539
MFKKWKSFDFTLAITPLILTAFGIVMIYSASMVVAVVEHGVPSNFFMMQQSKWFGISTIAFIIVCFIPYQLYQRLMKLIVVIMVALLILVLFIGDSVGNARSWIEVGPFQFQPSEIVKLGLIIYLASIYSKKQKYITDFTKAVLPPLVLTGIILALIARQPDIGTAAIIFLIACNVIISSGIKLTHLSLLIVSAVGLGFTLILKMVTAERISRFTGAYQPFLDPEDGGYQLIQSYVAIGTGGFTGEGLGQGVQKLGYLTQPHTDFIMAVIAEELGFIGVIIVIGLLATIVLRGLFISWKCRDSFGSLLAIGISSMIGIQSFINLGVVSGILPITGIPLPFVSYGGSSLLVMMVSMGILNNIARSVKMQEFNQVDEVDTTEEQPAFKYYSVNNKAGKTRSN